MSIVAKYPAGVVPQVSPVPKKKKKIPERNPSADGLGNTIFFLALTHCRLFWRFLQSVPLLERRTNWFLINFAVKKGPMRPDPLSTRPDPLSPQAAYSSWPVLTDRTYFARHLDPVAPYPDPRPDDQIQPGLDDVANLFLRDPRYEMRHSSKSTVLFSHFAQWFTDGFLRAEPDKDREPTLKTITNHEIDLSTLYGLNEAQTCDLREGHSGRLKSQFFIGEEFPPYYYDRNGQPNPQFRHLPRPAEPPEGLPEYARRHLFAIAFPRGNATLGFLMMHIIFLREHNRIAGILKAAHGDWGDERLFQTTRNILIVLLLKIVVEDYINHIAPYHFKFRVVKGQRLSAPWIRPNWVSLEFYLLYRWHSLVPNELQIGTTKVRIEESLYQSRLLIRNGLWDAFVGASRRPSGEIGLFNTPPFLVGREKASIRLGRHGCLESYNAYRERFSFPRVTGFDQISSNPQVCKELKRLYGSVDRIELYPGLFAEDLRPNSPLGPLMGRMVGCDAFSQALTNPLLAERVYNECTFSAEGLRIIDTTFRLRDIVERNTAGDEMRTEPKSEAVPVSFTYMAKPRARMGTISGRMASGIGVPAGPAAPTVEGATVAIFKRASAAAQQALGLHHLPRGAHPRHHGIVKAEFRVEPPPDAKTWHRGLFEKAGTYPAYVRFSNSGANPHDGAEEDIRGAAIKVMAVDGRKLLPDERFTQDFLLVDYPVFMATDPKDFLDFLKLRALLKEGKITRDDLDAHFPIFFPARSFARSVLNQTYFSQTPYRLGPDLHVKYRLQPTVKDPRPPLTGEEAAKKNAHYLKEELVSTLALQSKEFDFEIQPFQDQLATPLDNPTKEWTTPFKKIATLVIPQQQMKDTPERDHFVENISFNVWHSREEHEPLGSLNVSRRDVYLKMLAHRRSTNGVPFFKEPTGDEKL